jgi:hypothetical protein
MSMPWQLRRGLANRRKGAAPKPIAETLPSISVNSLDIPRNYQTFIASNISFRFPCVNAMRINYSMVQFGHSDRIQTFRFKWIKTGFGYPRPCFLCECGRPVVRLYFRHQHIACRYCHRAISASQVLGKHSRPILKAIRLETFFKLVPRMRKHNRARLIARIVTPQRALNSSRLSHHRIPIPHSRYRIQCTAHWL